MEDKRDFMAEEEDVTINIVTEDDQELTCDVIGIYEAGECEYIGLVPQGGDELYLYRYEENEDGIDLGSIEDMDEMNLAEEVFWDIFGVEEGEHDGHCDCGCHHAE